MRSISICTARAGVRHARFAGPTTHNLAEGAATARLAALARVCEELASQRLVVVLTGSNIDYDTLCRVLRGEL